MSKLFDPRKSFFELTIVRSTAMIIIGLALILLGVGMVGEGYYPSFTPESYNIFIKDFKLPLGILSLLIPFGALYAAQHRSEISIEQIKQSESQNNFANYYKHLEEFKLLLQDQNIFDDISNYRQLHLRLFPNVKSGNYKINNKIRENIISNLLLAFKNLKSIEKLSAKLIKNNEKNTEKQLAILKAFLKAYEPIKKIRLRFYFKQTDLDTITEHGLAELIDNTHLYNYVSGISQSVLNLIEISKFCEEFSVPAIMAMLSKLEAEDGLIHGIPTDRLIKFNLGNITEDGEFPIIVTEQVTESAVVPPHNIHQQAIVVEQKTETKLI